MTESGQTFRNEQRLTLISLEQSVLFISPSEGKGHAFSWSELHGDPPLWCGPPETVESSEHLTVHTAENTGWTHQILDRRSLSNCQSNTSLWSKGHDLECCTWNVLEGFSQRKQHDVLLTERRDFDVSNNWIISQHNKKLWRQNVDSVKLLQNPNLIPLD